MWEDDIRNKSNAIANQHPENKSGNYGEFARWLSCLDWLSPIILILDLISRDAVTHNLPKNDHALRKFHKIKGQKNILFVPSMSEDVGVYYRPGSFGRRMTTRFATLTLIGAAAFVMTQTDILQTHTIATNDSTNNPRNTQMGITRPTLQQTQGSEISMEESQICRSPEFLTNATLQCANPPQQRATFSQKCHTESGDTYSETLRPHSDADAYELELIDAYGNIISTTNYLCPPGNNYEYQKSADSASVANPVPENTVQPASSNLSQCASPEFLGNITLACAVGPDQRPDFTSMCQTEQGYSHQKLTPTDDGYTFALTHPGSLQPSEKTFYPCP